MSQVIPWKRNICNTCCGCRPYVPCCIRSMRFQYKVVTRKDDPDTGLPSSCAIKRFTFTNNVSQIEGPDWSALQIFDSEFNDEQRTFGGIPNGGCTFGVDIPAEHYFCQGDTPNFTVKVTLCNHHVNEIPSSEFPIYVLPDHNGMSLSVTFDEINRCLLEDVTPAPLIFTELLPNAEHEFVIDFNAAKYDDGGCFGKCVLPSGEIVLVEPALFFDDGFDSTCFKALNCDSGPSGQSLWTGQTALDCEDLTICPVCGCTRDDPVGFSKFNGIDSYIALDSNTPTLDAPFKLEAEIRLHNVTTFWPIFGREAAGGFLGMDDNDLVFGNITLPTSWTPVLNTWFKFRLEFEQAIQLQYKLFIDDVEVLDTTSIRQTTIDFINLGVFRHNDPGVIWGDFDMRFLKLQMGDAGNLTTALEMPLQVDAQDIGPLGNHGTTFNMDLPST